MAMRANLLPPSVSQCLIVPYTLRVSINNEKYQCLVGSANSRLWEKNIDGDILFEIKAQKLASFQHLTVPVYPVVFEESHSGSHSDL